MFINKADILCYSGNNFIAKSIKWFTEGYKETPTIISHCGLFANSGDLEQVDIIEALFPKGVVKRNFMKNYKNDLENCYILTPLNINISQRDKIVESATTYLNHPYGTLKLIPHAFDGLLGKIIKKRNVVFFKRLCFVKTLPICSSLVAIAYKSVGLDFGIKEQYATPDDIWDFAVNNTDKYKISIIFQG